MSYEIFHDPQYVPGVSTSGDDDVSDSDKFPHNEDNKSGLVENAQRLDDKSANLKDPTQKKHPVVMIHLFNLPPGIRWRNIKNDILLPHGIPEETILHIQVFDGLGSCIISLNSQDYSDILINDLEGFNYNGFYLNVRSNDEVLSRSSSFDRPIVPSLSPLIESIPVSGVSGPPSRGPAPHPTTFHSARGSLSLSTEQLQLQLQNRIIPPLGSSQPPPAQFFPDDNISQAGVPPPPFTPNYGYGPYGYVYPPYYPFIPEEYNVSPAALRPPPLGPPLPQGVAPPPPLLNYSTSSQRLTPVPFPLATNNTATSNHQHIPQRSFSRSYPQQFQGTAPSSNPSTASSSPLFSYRQFYPYRNSTTQSLESPSISSRTIGSLRQYPYQNITEIDPGNPKTRLFIGNIPYSSQWKDLKDYLRNAGSIIRVEIPSELDGTSKGFAIATYANEEDAKRAIELFDSVPFQGRPLTVRYDRFPLKRTPHTHVSNYEISSVGAKDAENEGKQRKASEVGQDAEDPGNADSSTAQGPEITAVSQQEQLDINERKYDDEARHLIESMRALNTGK